MNVDQVTDYDGVSNDEKTGDKGEQLSHNKTEESQLLSNQTLVHVNGEDPIILCNLLFYVFCNII